MNDVSPRLPSLPADDPERPRNIGNPRMGWASDVMAEVVRRLGFRYIALTPGASYRGLHDSLVNYLGNTDPQMILTVHEESAVAIAHGYSKVADAPMAVALHANIGLMHAVMAIYNAWCDRAPMLILGATGPVDSTRRRPWIEWIHTSKDQGGLVRNFIKWDDQPASVGAAVESLLRAAKLTRTPPHAPVYVCLDQALQESALEGEPVLPDVARYAPAPAAAIAGEPVRRAAELLRQARRPLILTGRVSRSQAAWDARIALAERLDARVVSDSQNAASFPSRHPLHIGGPRARLSNEQNEAMKSADVILSLDKIDLAGTLRAVWPDDRVTAKVISCTPDETLHNGWAQDHQSLPPADLPIAAHPDVLEDALLGAIGDMQGKTAPNKTEWPAPGPRAALPPAKTSGVIEMGDLAACFNAAAAGKAVTLTRLPFGWPSAACDFQGPLDYLGRDGGGGVGSAPGIAVGAALALRDLGGRLPVAIIGDGEYIMGLTALWTAARYRIPLLVVVADNRAFYNDVEHQERMAVRRNRPVENKWIGMQMDDPPLNLAGLARDQGLEAIGPIEDAAGLPAALTAGIVAVEAGKACVVDVIVRPGREPA
jgi:thiamine pyrophosphate-dependent acetolactate synthase large subunit-like protein